MGLRRDIGFKQGTGRTEVTYKAWEEDNQADSKAFRTRSSVENQGRGRKASQMQIHSYDQVC